MTIVFLRQGLAIMFFKKGSFFNTFSNNLTCQRLNRATEWQFFGFSALFKCSKQVKLFEKEPTQCN